MSNTNRPKTTQESQPWKATVRTIFQMLIGFAAMMPQLIEAANLSEATPWVGASLAISAGFTRIMAMPAIEDFLERFLPFLAADKRART